MDASAIINLLKGVTRKWARQRRREEREANAAARRWDALTRPRLVTSKNAAYAVMEHSYLEASANGTLPTRPRQIFYRARPWILQATGVENLDGQYFAQRLLVDFMAENRETTAAWDIAWDDRGHFTEPHTGKVIGLGTLAVRKYLTWVDGATDNGLSIPISFPTAFPTAGPRNRFQAVLFIEKEGFMPLFEHVRLAQRFDLALMSTKGLSVTAARTLIERLCSQHRIPLLVLHDFDKSGFSIAGTLRRDTRRYRFTSPVEVIDLGLRVKDVQKHDLLAEPIVYGKSDPEPNLRKNGATNAEIAFGSSVFMCKPRRK
jgi:DNA topoisomerase VI subunit A